MQVIRDTRVAKLRLYNAATGEPGQAIFGRGGRIFTITKYSMQDFTRDILHIQDTLNMKNIQKPLPGASDKIETAKEVIHRFMLGRDLKEGEKLFVIGIKTFFLRQHEENKKFTQIYEEIQRKIPIFADESQFKRFITFALSRGGMTQVEIAKILGSTQSQISKILTTAGKK